MLTTVLSPREYQEISAEVQELERRGLPVPDDILLVLEEHEARRRGLFFYKTFREFIEGVNPTLLRYEHIPIVIDELERVAQGDTKRLLVMLPPRYFKSEGCSRLFPAYYLRKFPKHHVGLISHTADLAWELSQEARSYYQATYGIFRSDTQAKKRWATDEGGDMWAYGFGGGTLGRGYNLGIVDDPVDPEHNTDLGRRRFKRRWETKFLLRAEPNAAIVFVMQRLDADDPVDFLFRREVGDGVEAAPENWRVLCLDEIKSTEPLARYNGPMGIPPTCTLVKDDRPINVILAPSRFSEEEVRKKHRSPGGSVAAAMLQQRPMEASGDFWQKDWFIRIYDDLPKGAYNGGKDWDTAYTKDEGNSASAFVESYRGLGLQGEFPIYIHDVDWRWLQFPEAVRWIASHTGPHYIEAKATGKSLVQTLKSHGLSTVYEIQVSGNKFERATLVQPAVADGRIWVRRTVYDKLLSGDRQGLLRIAAEHLRSEAGHLDVNDAFVQALMRHLGIGKKRKKSVIVGN